MARLSYGPLVQGQPATWRQVLAFDKDTVINRQAVTVAGTPVAIVIPAGAYGTRVINNETSDTTWLQVVSGATDDKLDIPRNGGIYETIFGDVVPDWWIDSGTSLHELTFVFFIG